MASVNFPNNPANNDIFTFGSRSWYWSNVAHAWLATTSSTLPITILSNVFTGNGSNTQFTFYNGSNTTQNSVIVSISGVVQQPTTAYSIVGSNNIITFSSAPPLNSLIEVKNLSGGLIGQTGYQGSTGDPGGPRGYTGSQGPTGFTGSAGINGINGATGPTGPQGTTGYTGSQSPTLVNSIQTTSYTLASTDDGKLINTASGVTVPAGIFSPGQTVTIYNNSQTASLTITQGSSVTMYLVNSISSGNRVLGINGVAFIMCVGANKFVISGSGVS